MVRGCMSRGRGRGMSPLQFYFRPPNLGASLEIDESPSTPHGTVSSTIDGAATPVASTAGLSSPTLSMHASDLADAVAATAASNDGEGDEGGEEADPSIDTADIDEKACDTGDPAVQECRYWSRDRWW